MEGEFFREGLYETKMKKIANGFAFTLEKQYIIFSTTFWQARLPSSSAMVFMYSYKIVCGQLPQMVTLT